MREGTRHQAWRHTRAEARASANLERIQKARCAGVIGDPRVPTSFAVVEGRVVDQLYQPIRAANVRAECFGPETIGGARPQSANWTARIERQCFGDLQLRLGHVPSMSAEPPGPRVMVAAAGRLLRSPVSAFVLIFLLSLAVRATLLVSYAENRDSFYRLGNGIEDRVASSLVRTGRFADPYLVPSGPTAHPPPLWPGILALIYSTFGVTATAGWVRGLVAIISYSTLFGLLPCFSRKLGLGTTPGVLAGVAGALIPRQGMDEIIGWGVTANAALALALVTVAFLDRWREERSSAAGSVLLGVGCGAAFHCSPPLLLVLLGNLAFEIWWIRNRRAWLRTACIAVGATLACVPWMWRNSEALGEFYFIRSNFGLELRIANQPGASADMDVTYARLGTVRHPSENAEEARLVRDLGEAEYMRRARNEATEWIKTHPREFFRLTVMRFVHFWCGPLRLPWVAALTGLVTLLALFGLHRVLPTLAPPGRAALLVPLAAFPLVYYFVSYQAHYPAPLAWLLLLLAGYEVQSRIRPTRP